MKANLIPFITLLLAMSPLARAGELLMIQGQSISPVEYETPTPVTTEFNSLATEIGVPVVVNEKIVLLPGASYRFETPRFIDPPEGAPPVPRLHQAELRITGLYKLDERWSLVGRLGGGLAGDFEAIDRDVVRISGFVLVSRGWSDHLRLGVGGALTWMFGQALPIPLLTVDWEPSEKIQIEALLPAMAVVRWSVHDRVRLGGFAELVGNEYAIRLPDITQGAECTSTDSALLADCIDHIAYTDGNGGGLVGARVAGEMWVELRAGVSFFRRFEILNRSNEPVSFGEQRLPPAPFIKLRLTYEY